MKRNFFYRLLLFAAIVMVNGGALNEVDLVTTNNLRCEMLENPQGIDVLQPRLSWQINGDVRGIEQTAYQVFVASSQEQLKNDNADVWNSGKIISSQSVHVAYAGKPLTSGTTYFWKVKIWTNVSEPVTSGTASWSTGLFKKTDWKARWIGLDRAFPWDSVTQWSRLSARYFRKQFKAPAPVKKATAYISGLGLYELYINGNKIGDQVLAPAPSDYTKTVFYNTHDVTSKIQKGENAVGGGAPAFITHNSFTRSIGIFNFDLQ